MYLCICFVFVLACMPALSHASSSIGKLLLTSRLALNIVDCSNMQVHAHTHTLFIVVHVLDYCKVAAYALAKATSA